MKTARPTTLALGSAILTVLLSVTGLAALHTGETLSVGPVAFGLNDGYRDAAAKLLRTGRPADLAKAEAKMRNAAALSPYDSQARVSVAMLDRQQNGRLTRAGLAQLRDSYALAPVDPQTAGFRIVAALENWPDLDRWTRRAAVEEIAMLYNTPSVRPSVVRILRLPKQPGGRVLGEEMLRRLQSNGDSTRPQVPPRP